MEENLQWCQQTRNDEKCDSVSAELRCQLTCELCTPSLVAVASAVAEADQVQQVQVHVHDHIGKTPKKAGFLQRITHSAKSLFQLTASTARSPAYGSLFTEDEIVGDQTGKAEEL